MGDRWKGAARFPKRTARASMNHEDDESTKLPDSESAKPASSAGRSFRATVVFLLLAIPNLIFWFGVIVSGFEPRVFAVAAFFSVFSGILWYMDADYRWKRRAR